MNENFFESSDMFLLKFCFEHLSLELLQLIVVQIAILVLITYSEYSQERLFILRLQLLLMWVEQRRYREQDCSLRAINDINQIHVSFGRTFNPHLHLLELHKIRCEQLLQICIMLRRPQVNLVSNEYDRNLNCYSKKVLPCCWSWWFEGSSATSVS